MLVYFTLSEEHC